jgi:hypothetical protein
MVLFSCYIISVGYWSGVILMLHYYFRLLAWVYSHVILLVIGNWSGVILMLHYYLRLLAWFYSHVILVVSATGLVSF